MFYSYLFAFIGFILAFLGKLFTNDANTLPLAKTILEFKEALTLVALSNGEGFGPATFSFHLLLDLLIPGVIYSSAIICMFLACRLLYLHLDTEKLEESLAKIVIMSLLIMVMGALVFNGGNALIIFASSVIVLMNIVLLVVAFGKSLMGRRTYSGQVTIRK
ncbi:hypothetical protein [Bacillus sp. FJAT-45350]|uniref:hypothetical protein n=1 Tax=Bacillus sp. FJAT-45350 TaxID=2011014 RepID=UPI000BB9A8F2|nr:hypothetical protein [Bacillus sp. FJAT-45350]